MLRIPVHPLSPFFGRLSSGFALPGPIIQTNLQPDYAKIAADRAAQAFIEEASWRYRRHLSALAAFGRSLPLATPAIEAGYKWQVVIPAAKREMIGWGAVMPFMDTVEIAVMHDGKFGHNADLLKGKPVPLKTITVPASAFQEPPRALKIAA